MSGPVPKTRRRVLALLAGPALLAVVPVHADPLVDGFRDPPPVARPRVWWHWLNGQVSEDGIRADLDWMRRAGIGGAQIIDVALGPPAGLVPTPLVYGSPEWKRALALAVRHGTANGLEMGIGAAAGWSETGGPWVQPKDGMKKLVWSETLVDGGRPFAGRLAPLPTVTGTYQNLAAKPLSAADDHLAVVPTASGDVATIAYRVTGDADALALPGEARVAGRPVSLAPLDTRGIDIPPPEQGQQAALELHYAAPQPVRAVTLAFAPAGMFTPFDYAPELQASDDGGASWRKVADLPYRNGVATTVSFPPATARDFRVLLVDRPRPPMNPPANGVESFAPFAARKGPVTLVALKLLAAPRIDRAEIKAGFAVTPDYYALPDVADGARGVDPTGVVDLTAHIRPAGTLDWTPPPGRWKVLRLGWSLLGTTNHPASREATGLEVDKMDRAAVHDYMERYLAFQAAAAPLGAGGIRTLVNDSTETGAANWTPAMLAQFRRLRGYDPLPWLPALTGELVGTRAQSDAFLYDFRRTVADLLASEHYGEVARVARARGIATYAEALEGGRPSLGGDLATRAHADVPMGALWTWLPGSGPRAPSFADLRGAASVAHLYGRKLVSAESMTSVGAPWGWAPADLKKVIDLEFALGVNQPIIHASTHQPVDGKVPGLSLLDVGQYFTRNETWGEMARPWTDYLARSSYLLQQGVNVADLAYFIGEEAPLTTVFGDKPDPAIPQGHAFDYLDADGLVGRLTVRGGDLVSPGGARYRALYLGGSSRRMTLATLRRVAALVEAGATVIGMRPEGSPSLNDTRLAFARLADRLWANAPVTRVGRGRVIATADAGAGLASAGVAQDVTFAQDGAGETLWVHRRLADGELYFINNRAATGRRVEASFRVAGKVPELWRAEGGTVEPVSFRVEKGRTIVPLDLAPEDAVFVVFRRPALASRSDATSRQVCVVARVVGPWNVTFQRDRGAPAEVRMTDLASLTESSDPGIRYFSGVATYAATVEAHRAVGGRVFLDLGRVGEVAEVMLNGRSVGYAWHAPYRVEIGSALRPGENRLEVRVANLWVNRLIGDKQPGAAKVTFTTMPTYRADAPLRPSGLIGPVTVLEEQVR